MDRDSDILENGDLSQYSQLRKESNDLAKGNEHVLNEYDRQINETNDFIASKSHFKPALEISSEQTNWKIFKIKIIKLDFDD